MPDLEVVDPTSSLSDFIREEYLTQPELAKALGRCARTLQQLDKRRAGPPKTKIGKLVLYRKAAVREWLAKQEQQQRDERPRRRRA